MKNKMQGFLKIIWVLLIAVSCTTGKTRPDKVNPNILWIVSEDNSPFLGCYGDSLANTPNLDKLASEGFLYTHAYANAPVCAPTRNTIITGVYACSNGCEHMRSYYPLSDLVKMFPYYLRKAGYYCTNNSKEDYNTVKPDSVWDESSNKAHYRNREPGQPFFHVRNTNLSHEHKIHTSIPDEELMHRPEDMVLPPYHPDTKEMRHDWAQYYDKITEMDAFMGNVLQELEDDGLADSTIVFYYSDHGGVLGRSKRYVYESGTHVPFIVRIPEMYKEYFPDKNPGASINRLISFVDLAPTVLSLAGIDIPDYLQGNAFLGPKKTNDPEYAFMFRGRMDEWYDMSRAARDHKYRYIKNYMPYRIYGQRVEYLWRAPSMQSWENAWLAGQCNETQSIFWNTKPPEELYDTENDPWEVNNLAGNPEFEDVLDRMRLAAQEWMLDTRDAGFIPEADMIRRSGDTPVYDYMRSGKVPLEEIMDAAEIASEGDPDKVAEYKSFLNNDDSAIRYWGATGLLMIGERASEAKNDLLAVLNDESPNVVVVAAEALYHLGEKDMAIDALIRVLEIPEDKARCHALNAIKYIGDDRQELRDAILAISGDDQYQYSSRLVEWFMGKWGLEL